MLRLSEESLMTCFEEPRRRISRRAEDRRVGLDQLRCPFRKAR